MSEHQEAKALMKWRDHMIGKMPELAALYAVPNGGNRDIVAASKLKAEGTMPGVADYHLPVARGKYHSLYVELKTETGRQSKAQKDFEALVTSHGNAYVVAHGWGKAGAALLQYLSHGTVGERI